MSEGQFKLLVIVVSLISFVSTVFIGLEAIIDPIVHQSSYEKIIENSCAFPIKAINLLYPLKSLCEFIEGNNEQLFVVIAVFLVAINSLIVGLLFSMTIKYAWKFLDFVRILATCEVKPCSSDSGAEAANLKTKTALGTGVAPEEGAADGKDQPHSAE